MTDSFSGLGMTSPRTRMRMVERLRQQGIADEDVLAVMGELPRHIFVEPALMSRAYDDVALPLGFGQTISQPWVVARMTSLLRQDISSGAKLGKVLEIGTGCGYQAAILGKLAREVYSVERVQPLMERARSRLRELSINNVRVRHFDGRLGLPDLAPFDAILMTAAAASVSSALVEQLAVGGKLVMPLGVDEQRLCLVVRTPEGHEQSLLEPVRFVPLLSGLA